MAPSRGMSALRRLLPTIPSSGHARSFATTPILCSGHNRWSKIKHDKGKVDAAKHRQRSVFAQELALSSKLHGPDPTLNTRLADLITKAKREGFAKTSIEAAIARGQGRSVTGAALESLTVEGVLKGNVGVIVECETDSKLRTLAEVRLAIKSSGGSTSPCSYLFERKGRVVFEAKEGVSSVDALEVALGAGATDVDELQDGSILMWAEPERTKTMGEAVAKELELEIAKEDIIWEPKEDTVVSLESENHAGELASFIDDLRGKESSVQAIAVNVAQGSLPAEAWEDLQSRLAA
nr:hypothetical protein B0A51_16748 [Rachicladosporium sp. CCFEE 5018]